MAGESRLDRIARELAAGEISRRSALKRLAGASLGIGAMAAPAGVAEAMGGGCPAGRVKCDGRCCPKNARCRNGRCKCKRGFKKCGRKCVDLDTSLRNCGTCGNVCGAGQVCLNGGCVTQVCTPGQTQSCYSGPSGTEDVGACQGGTQTCTAQGQWGPCAGEVLPQTETCDGIDNDCDGVVDNGFNLATDPQNCGACGNVCNLPNAENGCHQGVCYVVACQPGYHYVGGPPRDGPSGVGCNYACTPTGPEVCDGIDNNCNGLVDDGALCPEGQVCAGAQGCVTPT